MCEPNWKVHIRLRLGVVFCVAGESLAVEKALIEVLVRLFVRDGSLLRLAIGRRLVLALRHREDNCVCKM